MRSVVLWRRWASKRARTCIFPESSTHAPLPPLHDPDLPELEINSAKSTIFKIVKSHNQWKPNEKTDLPENISVGKKRIQSSNPDVLGLPLFIVSYISYKMSMSKNGQEFIICRKCQREVRWTLGIWIILYISRYQEDMIAASTASVHADFITWINECICHTLY